MWGILKKWFTPDTTQLPRAPDAEVHFYPPWPDSYHLQPPAQLLEPHGQIIRRIKDALALSDEDWERMLVPVLERLACHVQILPASEPKTEDGHHAFPGGLLHHCLESCYWALHFAHARNPYKHPLKAIDPEESNKRFKRWKAGVALAALCHDIGKPITDTRITSVETKQRWRPNHMSICEWAIATGTRRVRIDWIADRYGLHETVSTVYVERIIGNDFQDWITDSDESIWYDILASISSPNQHQSIMAMMANLGDRESTALDKAERKRHQIADHSMEPAAKLLLHLIRSFVNTRQHWQANENGARLWVTHHGVFITQRGLEEVADELRQRDYRRLIDDEYAVASTLLDGRYIEASDPEEHKIYWLVYPDMLRNADGQAVKLKMVRFIHAHHVFGDYELPPAIEAKVKAPSGDFLPTPASSYLNQRRRGGSRVDDGADRYPQKPDHSSEHRIDAGSQVDAQDPLPTEECRGPDNRGTANAAGVGETELPGWEQAAMAEQLKEVPDLFDILTDPVKAAKIVNIEYAPRLFLRLPLISQALNTTPKEVITQLARRQLIESVSGLTYPHDIGESVKGLLLTQAKFAQFYPFVASVVQMGMDQLDPKAKHAHAQITKSPAADATGTDQVTASGFSFVRRKLSPTDRKPAGTKSSDVQKPDQGNRDRANTASTSAAKVSPESNTRGTNSKQATAEHVGRAPATAPTGDRNGQRPEKPAKRPSRSQAGQARRSPGRGKTTDPKLSFAAHVCARTAQAIDARIAKRVDDTRPMQVPFADLKIDPKDTKLIECLIKRGYTLNLDEQHVTCGESDPSDG